MFFDKYIYGVAVYACGFFNLFVFFPLNMFSMKFVKLALSRSKFGIGYRRSNNFTEFPRICAPSDRPIVH